MATVQHATEDRARVDYEVGIDTGGTFTDVVVRGSDGSLCLTKLPTTRANPAEGVRQVVGATFKAWGIATGDIRRFVHGTTTATNAVLERKGAKIGLLTTEGFKDVLELGRQNRRQMYDLILSPHTPVFLAPGALRKEVRECIGPNGEVLTPLDEESLRCAVDALVEANVEAIAICFLFSFANLEHERQAAQYVRQNHPHLMVSVSSEVDPTFREYERTCVTAFDAYIKPCLDRYLEGMETDLEMAGVPASLQIMQSRGGIASSKIARQRPVRLFLSGPAAGVIGARSVGDRLEVDDLITVDIGGTSCDIALVYRGKPMVRQQGTIDGYAVRVPMVDVNPIGAGGGSIAWIDTGGGLRVGPQSAGAEPGPACYGRGSDDPTVTDASVVLGYINPDYFAGGTLKLDPDCARVAIRKRIAEPLGLTLDAAALGIHRVVNAQMAEGMRLVSISRGIDPRVFSLVVLGGAGPLHGTALARELGMSRVLVPRYPGVLSASGLLAAKIEHEITAAFPRALNGLDLEEVKTALARLDGRCGELMRAEGVAEDTIERLHFADLCYIGQSHAIEVPLDVDAKEDPIITLYEDFCDAHDRLHGHHTRSPATMVNLRTVHRVETGELVSETDYRPSAGEMRKPNRQILVAGCQGHMDAAVFDRAALTPDIVIRGPAIIEQSDTTTLIEPGWQGRIGPGGTLMLTRDA
jgi:N-methylhydantoinase A/oxoprolinase/acetone carboxylase beta subunit